MLAQIDAKRDGSTPVSNGSRTTAEAHLILRDRLHDRGQRYELLVSIESPPLCQSYRNSYWGLTLGAVYAVLSGADDRAC